jgi:glycosyltransferase involved in cell wall biosynthesis
MPPFFSIIVPVYNMEKYINRAITSILRQKFQDFEIIIVNDGSTDNTRRIIDEYTNSCDKISVINHLKNESLHIARMDGVAASNGQYVLFLDGDDYFSQNVLSYLYKTINKKPGYDFYEFGYIVQPSGDIFFPSFTGSNRFSAFFDEDNYPAHTMWNKAYSTSIIKQAFVYMERIYLNNVEDTYESVVIAYFAKNTFNIRKIITNYSFGIGVSTTYKDYDGVISFCQSVKLAFDLIKKFLCKVSQDICLHNLYIRIIDFTIAMYINTQKDIAIKKNLFRKLFEYFDEDIIIKYIFDKIALINEYKSIVRSFDYKFGKAILFLLRKIKKLFKKN